MPHPKLLSTSKSWNQQRPHVLVVACSDGRLQEPLDEFLNDVLNISHYDRLYLPGGPGALSSAGVEYMRASRMTEELRFLIRAHEIENVILMYHGPALDGPEMAVCADYRRIYPFHSFELIRKQQEADTQEILNGALGLMPPDKIHAYRMEVTGEYKIDVKQLK